MATQTIKRNSPRVRSPRHDCCKEECGAGSRNNYFLGKHLTPDSYLTEQRYAIERRRLINRAVHGWGVVYGFALAMREDDGTLAPGEIRIGEGLALDVEGRELIQACETRLAIDNLLILNEDHKTVPADDKLDDQFKDLFQSDQDCWLLRAHYAEKEIGLVPIKDPCRCDREEWDRTCETIVYSLEKIDCAKCCTPGRCGLDCCCPSDTGCCAADPRRKQIEERRDELIRKYQDRLSEKEHTRSEIAKLEREYSDEFDKLAQEEMAIPVKPARRGGCSCVCTHLTKLKLGSDCLRMRDVGDCTRADLGNGIALACLKLGRDGCDRVAIQSVEDACGPRSLVKRNDLLFDLIEGCDLTRIDLTGWSKWHRRSSPAVPFEEFLEALGWTGESADEEYPTRDFWVRFSRPVRRDTLTPDAFVMAIMGDHEDDYWRRYYRVPILAIDTDKVAPEKGDPPDHVRSAKIVVWSKWLRNSFVDDDSIFGQGYTRVEIEVRGDLIVDCLGQQVDANSSGRVPHPTGNGSPGGTYLSSFTVGPRVVAPPPPPPPASEHAPSPPKPRRQTNRVR